MDFMELGHALFLDKGKLKSKFIAADVFDGDSELKQLDAKVDILHASCFLHLFNWDQQVQIAKRIVRLLRPQPGSLLMGRQVGNLNPGEYKRRYGEGSRYRHDATSWEKMWVQVGEETGSRWKVDATLETENVEYFESERVMEWSPAGTRRLVFTVRRE